jgi:hypothetical protein
VENRRVDCFRGFWGIHRSDNLTLIIHDRVELGQNMHLMYKLIEIESDPNVGGVRVMDSDAPPQETAGRNADIPRGEDDVKPVRNCWSARIGRVVVNNTPRGPIVRRPG